MTGQEREQIGELLTAYIDGELSDEEHAHVSRLIEENPEARRMVVELRQTAEMVGELPDFEAPADLNRDILSHLHTRQQGEHPDSSTAPPPQGWTVWARAAVLLLAVGAGLWAVFLTAPDTEQHLAKTLHSAHAPEPSDRTASESAPKPDGQVAAQKQAEPRETPLSAPSPRMEGRDGPEGRGESQYLGSNLIAVAGQAGRLQLNLHCTSPEDVQACMRQFNDYVASASSAVLPDGGGAGVRAEDGSGQSIKHIQVVVPAEQLEPLIAQLIQREDGQRAWSVGEIADGATSRSEDDEQRLIAAIEEVLGMEFMGTLSYAADEVSSTVPQERQITRVEPGESPLPNADQDAKSESQRARSAEIYNSCTNALTLDALTDRGASEGEAGADQHILVQITLRLTGEESLATESNSNGR